jgi:hypothetical protein
MWYSLASSQGQAQARERQGFLTKSMTAAQIARADEQARAWTVVKAQRMRELVSVPTSDDR